MNIYNAFGFFDIELSNNDFLKVSNFNKKAEESLNTFIDSIKSSNNTRFKVKYFSLLDAYIENNAIKVC